MEFLKCFTVNDDIAEGIHVSDFESIIVADPSTTLIKKATIEMIPVLTPASRNTNDVTESSLVFLHEADKQDKESSDHMILAVDPTKWRLCATNKAISLLDPCGLNGYILLLVNKNAEHLLINAGDRGVSLQLIDQKPTIAKCHRAALIRSVVLNRRITDIANMLPSQYRTTAPKA